MHLEERRRPILDCVPARCHNLSDEFIPGFVFLNALTNEIEVLQGELEEIEPEAFDLVLANLHRNLIIRLLPEIVTRLNRPAGQLMTSGVLIEDYQGLVDAAGEQGLQPHVEERENEWIATTFCFAQE